MDTMQDQNQNKHTSGCNDCCGWGDGMGGRCMGGMRGRHMAHIVVKILVALFIFWCGVQFGELKTLLHGGQKGYDGYGMMNGYSGYGMMGGYRNIQNY